MAKLLSELHPDEIEIAVAFLSGQIRQGRIGVGYAILREAAGSPATNPSLELTQVDRTFQAISTAAGGGSQRRRFELLQQMFAQATQAEEHFLIALLAGELRQGALEAVMVEALAKASGVAAERVRRGVMMAGDLAPVAREVLEKGDAGLAAYDVQLFRPIQPMLAGSAEDVSEALAELGEAALEFKMDGARVQVHKSDDNVVVYSRSLKDVTAAVPEVVEIVRALPARNLILDGEVLSLQKDGRPQPFQVTARRFSRKLDVDRMRTELPMTPFWFDLLYLNGGPLLDEPQARRFDALAGLTSEFLMPHTIASDAQQAARISRAGLEPRPRGHHGQGR